MIGQARLAFAAWAATVLGACVLVPVFSGPFLFVSAFLCAVVTATGVVLQSWRTPGILVPLIQLLVLVETVSVLFYSDTLRYLVVPWEETALAFNQQMVDALDGINRYSAPLPPETYFTVFASGVIALTGLAIHLIAVQLRQASWSGLLLLMMYTVPAATVHGGLSAVWFIPPAVGYIVLLSAEGRSRLARWGRRIGGVTTLEANDQIEASAAGQAGRRIGVTVIAVAALLPALLPTLPEGVFGNGLAGGGTGGGLGGTVSLGTNPMLDMGRNLRRGENTVALTYTGDPAYLRFTALDQFDGQIWTTAQRSSYADVDGTFQPPPGLAQPVDSLQQKKHDIRVSKSLRISWVPTPYPTRSLSINGRWRYDPNLLDVQSANGRTVAGLHYKTTSYELNPTEDQLRNAVETGAPDQHTLEVPQSTPARIRSLARTLTAKAQGNHYLQAAALQQWFRDTGGFVYDTGNDSRSGMRAIEEFLFESKRGYCEQFATAMALMARTLGIPARIGMGFLPGRPDGDKYVVRMHDMHAWPELYFEGIGWVRFEPTPAQQTGQAPGWTLPTNTSPTNAPTTAPTGVPGTDTTGSASPRLPNEANLPDEGGAAVGSAGGWWSGTGVRWGAGLLGLIALGMVPWLIRILIRRRRFARAPGQASVEGLWAEIRDTARDIGLDWSDSATPRQAGAWLVGKLPADVRPQAIRLARAVEFGRYAGATPRDVDLRDEADVLRRALFKTASASNRWRARLLPRSWRWYLSRGTSEASDLLDQFDLALARLRSLVVPRRRST
jgi:transglutaminase-like putative cysteine protease